ncbi:MAG: hypothetical protein LRY73_10450 [Bacillus sp. (in: Bacteria)]|nr:hypothetical protein [Bacillus sp. (in: firmicutes)]
MKKIIFLLSIFLVILTVLGCSEEEEGVYELDGRLSGYGYYNFNTDVMLNIFVEDNLFGSYLKYSYWEPVPEDYELEAYRLIITEETTVYLGDTDETINLLYTDGSHYPMFLSPGRKITAVLSEPLEKRVSNSNEYALFHQVLLPIYYVEELRVYELTEREFLRLYSPYKRNEYLLLAVFEEENEESWDSYMEIEEALFEFRRSPTFNMQSWYQSGGYGSLQSETFDFTEYPTYLILSERGLEKQTAEVEEVLAFFEEKSGEN